MRGLSDLKAPKMIKKLQHTIEKLYTVFEKYSASDLSGSPIYEELSEWNRQLLSKPLHELNEEDLSRFTFKAMTTWGSAIDFKHFLPRILDLTAAYRTPYDIGTVFDKLALADWRTWPEEEQSAVEEFLIHLWENLINDNSAKAEMEFSEYFAAISGLYPHFSHLLQIWEVSGSKAAIKHLSELIIKDPNLLFGKKKKNGFHHQKENLNQLIEWALSDAIGLQLEEKFFEFENESFAQNISWAEQILSQERKNLRSLN